MNRLRNALLTLQSELRDVEARIQEVRELEAGLHAPHLGIQLLHADLEDDLLKYQQRVDILLYQLEDEED